jgi:hypothetical protein
MSKKTPYMLLHNFKDDYELENVIAEVEKLPSYNSRNFIKRFITDLFNTNGKLNHKEYSHFDYERIVQYISVTFPRITLVECHKTLIGFSYKHITFIDGNILRKTCNNMSVILSLV